MAKKKNETATAEIAAGEAAKPLSDAERVCRETMFEEYERNITELGRRQVSFERLWMDLIKHSEAGDFGKDRVTFAMPNEIRSAARAQIAHINSVAYNRHAQIEGIRAQTIRNGLDFDVAARLGVDFDAPILVDPVTGLVRAKNPDFQLPENARAAQVH